MDAAEPLNLATLAPYLSDKEKAAQYLESIRWPDGVVCPKCGESEREPYRLKNQKRRLWKCRACRQQFTVTVGTIFESSHIGLDKWLLAFYLLCSSKKGMSAHQLHRSIGVTYKTAWFMFHRIRHAMDQGPFQGQLSGIVEVDETYIGGRARGKGMGYKGNKAPVVSLVERQGNVRSMHIADVTSYTLKRAVREHVAADSRLMTDEWAGYTGLDRSFASHETVKHAAAEYVRGDAYTNTVESYFATLKRGIEGVYHHVSREHLSRYLSEFDFRYNTRGMSDGHRTIAALAQTEGKRLRYAD